MRSSLAEADFITAVSARSLADAEEFFGRSFGARARVIYNGVNLVDNNKGEVFNHPKPYILGIGRLVPQKGFDVLLQAFAKTELPAHDVIIAGDGVEREQLERLVVALGLQGRVQFVGQTSREVTASLFKGCSFVAVPSRGDEGLPMVIMEAMAAGKPVVASKVGGVPEIVADGETGILVPRADVEALSSALGFLAQDVNAGDSMGLHAYAKVQALSWAAIASEYADVYRTVCAGRSERIPT